MTFANAASRSLGGQLVVISGLRWGQAGAGQGCTVAETDPEQLWPTAWTVLGCEDRVCLLPSGSTPPAVPRSWRRGTEGQGQALLPTSLLPLNPPSTIQPLPWWTLGPPTACLLFSSWARAWGQLRTKP